MFGIRPLGDVDDVKITAHLPSGVIEPLIWLREYKANWHRTFVFREPILLPAGTKIVSQPPVPFEFLASPRRNRTR